MSMTDGVVERIGWLPLGAGGSASAEAGWLFFTMPISSYGRAFQKGDRVSAGDLLGYMGDSGYGPEGTTGRFDVHLHIGIYRRRLEEISVNPYQPLLSIWKVSIDFKKMWVSFEYQSIIIV